MTVLESILSPTCCERCGSPMGRALRGVLVNYSCGAVEALFLCSNCQGTVLGTFAGTRAVDLPGFNAGPVIPGKRRYLS